MATLACRWSPLFLPRIRVWQRLPPLIPHLSLSLSLSITSTSLSLSLHHLHIYTLCVPVLISWLHIFLVFARKKLLSVTEQLSTSASQFECICSLFIHFCCTGPSSRLPVLLQAAAVRTRSPAVMLSCLWCEQHMLSFLYWHTYRLWGSSLNLQLG